MAKAEHVFIDGKRFHKTAIGNLPGVTSVLSATKSERDRNGIEIWKRKVGQEVADRIVKEACIRGDYVHAAIEAVLEDRQIEYSATESTDLMIAKMAEYAANLKAKTSKFRIEEAMFSKLGYAGSPDCLALGNDGELVLYDWKTASRRKTRSWVKDYILQICAYWQMCDERFQTKISSATITICYIDKDSGLAEIIEHHVSKEQYEEGVKEFNRRLSLFYGEIPEDNDDDEEGVIW